METIGFIFGLFGLGIVISVVYGLYRGMGPRLFWKCCVGLAYAILWIVVLVNSKSVAGEYAWVLNILPGVLLVLHFTVKIYRIVNEKFFSNSISYYDVDGCGIEAEKAYNIQKRLTRFNGKKKYLYGFKRVLAKQKNLAFEKRVEAEDSTGFEGMMYQKEAKWGTKAGIAGGLFGTAAGIAVAADEIAKTERYNQMAREHNKRLMESGWKPGGIKAARINSAKELAANVDYLSGTYYAVKDAPIVFRPEEEPHITVTYDTPSSSWHMDLYVSNTEESANIGSTPATLDGAFRIMVLNSKNHVVGDAYYNPPGFAERNLCDVGFSRANRIRVVAISAKDCTFSSNEEYTFRVVPIKVWKIAQN